MLGESLDLSMRTIDSTEYGGPAEPMLAMYVALTLEKVVHFFVDLDWLRVQCVLSPQDLKHADFSLEFEINGLSPPIKNSIANVRPTSNGFFSLLRREEKGSP